MLLNNLEQLHLTIIEACSITGKIALLTHTNPDGDGLPACLALKEILTHYGFNADIVIDKAPPQDLLFLETAQQIKTYNDSMSYSTVFMIDCHEPERTGNTSKLVFSAERVIAIDHHQQQEIKEEWNYYIDPACVSAGAIILKTFYKELYHFKKDKKKYIADCIYTTILNDTDGFINNNTDSEVFKLCAQVCELGTIPSEIIESFILNHTPQKLRFIGQAMASSELHFDNRVMFIHSTQQDFKENGLDASAASKVTKWVKGARGIDVFIYAREEDNGDYRLSLRSPVVNCNHICGKFGGGGHTSASGCHIEGSLKEIRESILAEVKKELDG